jgi:hypothetical protein
MFFNDVNGTMRYLAACSTRGNRGFDNYVIIDLIMTDLIEQFPLATMDFYRVKIATIRGLAVGSYSEDQIRLSFRRCRVTTKQGTFVSARQDAMRIDGFIMRMRNINPENLCNWDQCSCSAEKYRPTSSRGQGRIIVHEWNIGGRYLSAMAAVVPTGVLYFEVIEGTYSHVEVEAFLERLRPFSIA